MLCRLSVPASWCRLAGAGSRHLTLVRPICRQCSRLRSRSSSFNRASNACKFRSKSANWSRFWLVAPLFGMILAIRTRYSLLQKIGSTLTTGSWLESRTDRRCSRSQPSKQILGLSRCEIMGLIHYYGKLPVPVIRTTSYASHICIHVANKSVQIPQTKPLKSLIMISFPVPVPVVTTTLCTQGANKSVQFPQTSKPFKSLIMISYG